MLRALCFALALCVATAALTAETAPASGEKVDLDKFMAELEQFGRENRRLNVPADHGRFLQLLIEATKSRRALEIGASNGYSSLWIARGLRRTGGKLVTIEYDKVRGGEAKENFTKAGMDDIITLHLDDAFKVIPDLEGEFDFVFCDAWKDDYKKFFDLVFPKLKPGGLFVAHNAIQSAEGMKDFLDAVKTDPRLITSIVQMGRDGFSVSIKRVEGK